MLHFLSDRCLLFDTTLMLLLVLNQSGGPYYDVAKGRKDGRRSRIEDTINLPPPTLNSTDLIEMFAKHGFTVQELVVLSGRVSQASSNTNHNRIATTLYYVIFLWESIERCD